jgi:hypothetical protein
MNHVTFSLPGADKHGADKHGAEKPGQKSTAQKKHVAEFDTAIIEREVTQ